MPGWHRNGPGAGSRSDGDPRAATGRSGYLRLGVGSYGEAYVSATLMGKHRAHAARRPVQPVKLVRIRAESALVIAQGGWIVACAARVSTRFRGVGCG